MDIMKEILNYLSQGERPVELIKLIVTLATAYFTVTWSLKRFLKEKKWEKQSEAYSRIIEALHHLKRIDMLDVDDEWQLKKIDEEESKKIRIQYNEAKKELEKYVDIGRYYISNDALAALEKLHKTKQECQNDWHNELDSPFSIYERELEATVNCLEEIKAIAIKEIHK